MSTSQFICTVILKYTAFSGCLLHTSPRSHKSVSLRLAIKRASIRLLSSYGTDDYKPSTQSQGHLILQRSPSCA